MSMSMLGYLEMKICLFIAQFFAAFEAAVGNRGVWVEILKLWVHNEEERVHSCL